LEGRVTPTVDCTGLGSYAYTALNALQSQVNSNVFSNPIPLAGASLPAASATQFLNDIGTQIYNNIANATTPSAVYNGLNNVSSTGVVETTGTNSVHFTIEVDAATLSILRGSAIPANLGLPGLPLSILSGGAVNVTVNYGVTVGLNVYQPTGGRSIFSLDTTPFTFHVATAIPNFLAAADVGMLRGTVSDNVRAPSSFSGNYTVHFALNNNNYPSLVTGNLTGSSAINLHLDADMNQYGAGAISPRFTAEIVITWGFNNASTLSYPFGNVPSVAVNNVQLDLSSFFNNFVAPVVQQVQSVTRTFSPIVTLLNTDVPVVSELNEQFSNGTPLTWADVLSELDGGNTGFADFIAAVEQINNLTVPSDGSGTISLGNFTLTDPRAVDAQGDAKSSSISNYNIYNARSQIGGDLSNFLNNTSRFGPHGSAGFEFPILDNPFNAFLIFLGRDADLFTFTTPELAASVGFDETFPTPLSIGDVGLTVNVDGSLGFYGRAVLGYDTSGIRNGNPLNGFWVADGFTDANGRPESVQINAHLGAGPGVGIPDIAYASVEGGVDGDVYFRLANTDANGRVHANQFASEGGAIFNTSGTITAGLQASLTVLWQTRTWNIASVKLANWNIDADQFGLGLIDPTITDSDESDAVGHVLQRMPSNLTQLASTLTHSAEHYQALVQSTYKKFLGRSPAATESNFWVSWLESGWTDADLQASFAATSEYVQKHGGLGANWVKAVYIDLFDRNASNTEVNYWTNQLAAGVSPNTITYTMIAGLESQQVTIQQDYLDDLGRQASASEANYWVHVLQSGVRNEDIQAALLGSAENFTNHGTVSFWFNAVVRLVQGSPSATNAPGANQLAAPSDLGSLANVLAHSTEHYQSLVQAAYEQILGRVPSAAEVNYWVQPLQSGWTDEAFQATLAASSEDLQKHGGAGATWIQGLYQSILGRASSSAEVNYWLSKLTSGMTALQVAYNFTAGAECLLGVVQQDYQQYLGRAATVAEEGAWVQAIWHGTHQEDVIAALLGSTESFHAHNSSDLTWFESGFQNALFGGPENDD